MQFDGRLDSRSRPPCSAWPSLCRCQQRSPTRPASSPPRAVAAPPHSCHTPVKVISSQTGRATCRAASCRCSVTLATASATSAPSTSACRCKAISLASSSSNCTCAVCLRSPSRRPFVQRRRLEPCPCGGQSFRRRRFRFYLHSTFAMVALLYQPSKWVESAFHRFDKFVCARLFRLPDRRRGRRPSLPGLPLRRRPPVPDAAAPPSAAPSV